MRQKTRSHSRVLALGLSAVMLSGFIALPAGAADPQIPETFQNPVIKTDYAGNTIYTADPSVRVINGELWMFASHDEFPARRCNTMDNYHVFKSVDGQNWEDVGLDKNGNPGAILSAADLTWAKTPAQADNNSFMWAPDGIQGVDNKFYFYYPHPQDASESGWGASWKIAVAVADKPEGPYTDLGPVTYPGGEAGGQGMIDPNVFIDDDGQAYLYYGGGGKLVGAKLNADMRTLESAPVDLVAGLTGYQEGPWLFKRGGLYYMSYAHGRGDNQMVSPTIGYGTSTSPMGPFTFQGDIMTAHTENGQLDSAMDTAHGSVVEYPAGSDNWLVFYHNKALSGDEVLRSVCADHVTFNADGSIKPVKPAANTPPVYNTVAPPASADKYPVNPATWTGGLSNKIPKYASNTEGLPAKIGDTQAEEFHRGGAYAQIDIIDGGTEGGRFKITFHYADADQLSAIHVRVGGLDGTDFKAAVAIPTGGWGNYLGYTSTEVTLAPGKNTLVVYGGDGGFNFDTLYVEKIDEPVLPSASPSASDVPSASPSASDVPSASPSTSDVPSASPSTSDVPSASPSTSDVPSASPAASAAPSATPGDADLTVNNPIKVDGKPYPGKVGDIVNLPVADSAHPAAYYTLEGYYLGANKVAESDGKLTLKAEYAGQTLVAKFKAKTFTIVVKSGKGKFAKNKKSVKFSLAYGSKLKNLGKKAYKPKLKGKKLAGFYTKSKKGKKVTKATTFNTASVTISKKGVVTLYARYK